MSRLFLLSFPIQQHSEYGPKPFLMVFNYREQIFQILIKNAEVIRIRHAINYYPLNEWE